MRLAPKALRLACILIASSIALFAGEPADAPGPLPKTVAVAAFKNGLAFVLRQGEIPLSAGVGRLSPVPNATLGTLWLAPANLEARIDEIVAYRYNIPGQRPIPSIGEVLRANAGKTVTITYQMKEYTGEVIGLKDTTTADPSPPQSPPQTRATHRTKIIFSYVSTSASWPSRSAESLMPTSPKTQSSMRTSTAKARPSGCA